MGLVFVPVYIRFVGIEAYGLLGIFAAILGLFAVLDLGFSSTLNREMARLSVVPGKAQEMRDLVRTLEIPYWLIGVLIAMGLVVASPFVVRHWITANALTPQTVELAFVLMGVCLAIQWPIGYYSGGLMGLQRQVLVNGINTAIASLRGIGAVGVLWLISPTIEAFFKWQIIVSVLHLCLMASSLWRSLPHTDDRPRFRPDLFREIWRFAAGVTGIAITATLLTQLDKIILSRMLPLEVFGYYSLANVTAMVLYRLINPIYGALYPRLTCLVQLNDLGGLAKLYHKSAQLVALAVLPAALVLAAFSHEILYLWTQNEQTASRAHQVVTLLVIGNALHCIMHVPYALQLAHRWTRLGFYFNLSALVIMVPLTIFATMHFGAVGAASVWIVLNILFLALDIPIMHRRLLPASKLRWYLADVGRPALAVGCIVMLGRFVVQPGWSGPVLMGAILVIAVLAVLAAVWATPDLDLIQRIRATPAGAWFRKTPAGTGAGVER